MFKGIESFSSYIVASRIGVDLEAVIARIDDCCRNVAVGTLLETDYTGGMVA